ncbi:hypothetical protein HDU91_004184, partial [Kappamyces sp. JEL0680]
MLTDNVLQPRTAMGFGNLPKEIIYLILSFLPAPDLVHPSLGKGKVYYATLAAAAQVNKAWNHAATSILWRNLVVDKSNLLAVASAILNSARYQLERMGESPDRNRALKLCVKSLGVLEARLNSPLSDDAPLSSEAETPQQNPAVQNILRVPLPGNEGMMLTPTEEELWAQFLLGPDGNLAGLDSPTLIESFKIEFDRRFRDALEESRLKGVARALRDNNRFAFSYGIGTLVRHIWVPSYDLNLDILPLIFP